jgi:ABC-type transport system involved in cytochrome bd biosynthesis fused ATPase/permease subunit
LDPTNQDAVLETIKDSTVECTTEMVTHKIATMEVCDRTSVVRDGAIAGTGTFGGLMDREGIFTRLRATNGSQIGRFFIISWRFLL